MTAEDFVSLKENSDSFLSYRLIEFGTWAREWEALISVIGDTREALLQQIKFETERAHIYKEAGLREFAEQAIDDAIFLAQILEQPDEAQKLREDFDS